MAGCAKPPPAPPKPRYTERVILLPSRDGRPSALVVKDATGERDLTKPYQGVELGTGVERPMAHTEAEVSRRYGEVMRAQPARPFTYTLYFVAGRTDLTPQSRTALDEVREKIKGFPAAQVTVIGHTDRVGSTEANDALSLKRAGAVRDLRAARSDGRRSGRRAQSPRRNQAALARPFFLALYCKAGSFGGGMPSSTAHFPPPRSTFMSDYKKERYERGMALLKKMGRENLMMDQKALSQDLYEMSVGHLFGDVWSRPGLSLRERQLVTLAANIAMARPTGNHSHYRAPSTSGSPARRSSKSSSRSGITAAGRRSRTPCVSTRR
jgi:alkylhydroperoxidase/carboxymuconolactone decarboxylase family protein YurZ